jgi:hypothetical protein
MRRWLHRAIVWYLHRCWGSFHVNEYGPQGRYVVLMSEGQYRAFQDRLND